MPLVYLPFSHHQHMSLSVQPHLYLRKGAIMACPLRSWKYLAAIRLGTPLSCGLMPSLELGVGKLKTLLPAFLSLMSFAMPRLLAR